MRLNPGDVIKSVHTGGAFVVEYVSADGHCFILQPRDKENSRSYNMHDFNRSFVRVSESDTLQTGNSPVTPGGYVLVPKEITCAMDDAAWEAYHETRCMSDIWAALLAAAPQQEVHRG
ncbi:hypothetical protein LFZ8_03115 [Salmonella enterica subsp. enterica serovar Djakarta str. S-1087]|uniref:hypothetical protein n=1 Tax=Salmonella enterica TaxID=28901 RepID=UPI000973CA71|nr:hypothetical protein [Salmonella enterica]APY53889.1 hypothetical protein LFZ8_03115 [Salmonella enterica subsp. enterica serovar Djakarta str. S-1087]